jgi:hypothetical protein
MRHIEEWMEKNGIETRTQPLATVLNGNLKQSLGGSLPTDIGLIYGFSLDTDAPDAATNPQITTTDASNLYLTVAMGAQLFLQQIRLDKMLQVFAGVPVIQPRPYMPVFLKFTSFNLNDSFYNNPTAIGAPSSPVIPEINLMLWVLSLDDFNKYRTSITHEEHTQAYETQHMVKSGVPIPTHK